MSKNKIVNNKIINETVRVRRGVIVIDLYTLCINPRTFEKWDDIDWFLCALKQSSFYLICTTSLNKLASQVLVNRHLRTFSYFDLIIVNLPQAHINIVRSICTDRSSFAGVNIICETSSVIYQTEYDFHIWRVSYKNQQKPDFPIIFNAILAFEQQWRTV